MLRGAGIELRQVPLSRVADGGAQWQAPVASKFVSLAFFSSPADATDNHRGPPDRRELPAVGTFFRVPHPPPSPPSVQTTRHLGSRVVARGPHGLRLVSSVSQLQVAAHDDASLSRVASGGNSPWPKTRVSSATCLRFIASHRIRLPKARTEAVHGRGRNSHTLEVQTFVRYSDFDYTTVELKGGAYPSRHKGSWSEPRTK